MMRNALISAIMTTLVFFALHSLLAPEKEAPVYKAQVSNLYKEVQRISELLEAMRVEVDELHTLVVHGAVTNDIGQVISEEKIGYEGIINRIESMEEALSEVSTTELSAPDKMNGERKSSLSKKLQTVEEESADLYADAEEHFETDSGIPIGNYAASIEQSITSVNGIDVSGMQCGKAICKVTYSMLDTSRFSRESQAESELSDKLLFSTEGQDVDLRYANDPFGNRVVYIQLQ